MLGGRVLRTEGETEMGSRLQWMLEGLDGLLSGRILVCLRMGSYLREAYRRVRGSWELRVETQYLSMQIVNDRTGCERGYCPVLNVRSAEGQPAIAVVRMRSQMNDGTNAISYTNRPTSGESLLSA